MKKGQEQEIRTFQSNLPTLVDQQCHDALQTKHDLGFAEGDKAGFDRGRQEGLAQGTADGQARAGGDCRQRAAADAAQRRDAADNWSSYAGAVAAAAQRAADLPKNKPDLQKQFISAVETIVADADTLNQAYHAKADAFDSTVALIRVALKEGDYEKVRTLTITLGGTLPVKKNLFFAQDKDIEGASADLSKVVVP